MLDTRFCNMTLKNPVILASGVLGVTRSSLANVVKNGAGAVTMKSISREPRKGHNNPIIITYEGGMMNAVGYSNPGLEKAKQEFSETESIGAPVIASIIGNDAEEFAYMAKNFLDSRFAAVELPLSCPHTPGFGVLAGQSTPQATAQITKAVKQATDLPIIVKLSPSVPNITELALAAQEAGADAINMGNTHGPGMVIDVVTQQPILDFKVGGLSGPGIRPIGVRCVYDLYKTIRIPIIGTGGITTWKDALQYIMAGATVVGVGSAVYYGGSGVFRNICKGMEDFMKEQNISHISQLVGAAHD